MEFIQTALPPVIRIGELTQLIFLDNLVKKQVHMGHLLGKIHFSSYYLEIRIQK